MLLIPQSVGVLANHRPGLNDHQLNEGRDLALTTDFRSVLGEILSKHNGVADLKPVFPGFDNNRAKFPGLIRAQPEFRG